MLLHCTIWYPSTFTPLYKAAPLAAEEKLPCIPSKLVFWMAQGQCKSLHCPTDIFTMHYISETIVGIILVFITFVLRGLSDSRETFHNCSSGRRLLKMGLKWSKFLIQSHENKSKHFYCCPPINALNLIYSILFCCETQLLSCALKNITLFGNIIVRGLGQVVLIIKKKSIEPKCAICRQVGACMFCVWIFCYY